MGRNNRQMWNFRKGNLKNICLVITFTVLLLCAAFNIQAVWEFVKRLFSFVSPVLTVWQLPTF